MPEIRARSGRRGRSSFAVAILLALTGLLAVAPAAHGATAPWLDVELYYLKLLNCTRTGGWVLADGSCRGYGTGRYSDYRKPFDRHRGVSREVARPYAKLMADRGRLSHFLDGSPLDRFHDAGYHPSEWGENIGYWAGDPYDAVVEIHRMFQAEKNDGGIHWKTIKKRSLKFVGIGVWRKDGYTYLVTDFFTP